MRNDKIEKVKKTKMSLYLDDDLIEVVEKESFDKNHPQNSDKPKKFGSASAAVNFYIREGMKVKGVLA